MDFESIQETYEELYHRDNNTAERVFEFEFYSIMNDPLSVLYAFETHNRKALNAGDQYELLSQLERTKNLLESNIKYLDASKKEGFIL